jgi:hypothetical protein
MGGLAAAKRQPFQAAMTLFFYSFLSAAQLLSGSPIAASSSAAAEPLAVLAAPASASG